MSQTKDPKKLATNDINNFFYVSIIFLPPETQIVFAQKLSAPEFLFFPPFFLVS